MEAFRLDGDVAVVTGGGSGIGAASAVALARHGARVVVLDIDFEAAESVANGIGGAVAVRCDVTDPDAVARAFDGIREKFGFVSVLHNNAGNSLVGPHGDRPADELELATWRKTIDVNLTGCFLCAKYALPLMLAHGGGSIVNTASLSGPFIGSANTAYAASKGGLVGLTRSLAVTHGRRGIRTNAICPGSVRTPLAARTKEKRSPEDHERLINAVPLGRIAEPEDVANLVVFLSSPAGAYLNGAIIALDGGLSVC